MSLNYFPLRRGRSFGAGTVGGWQITSYFGGRIDPLTGRAGTHGGMDLATSNCRGEEMIAVKPGRISQGWDPSGGGNWTGLICDDGDYFGYGHALRFVPLNGQHVEAGTVIAYVDSTGGSTGDHLHFAYRPRGANGYRDPYDLLVEASNAGRFVGDPGSPPIEIPTPDPIPSEDDDMAQADRDEIVARLGGNTDEAHANPYSIIAVLNAVNALAASMAGHDADDPDAIGTLAGNVHGDNPYSIAAVMQKLDAMDVHYNERLNTIEAKLA